MNHSQSDQRLACPRQTFVILAQPPTPPQAGERPLHHPTLALDDEPLRPRRTLHHLQPPADPTLLDPLQQAISLVTPVSPDHLQIRIAFLDILERQFGAAAVLDPRRVDHDGQQQPQPVHHDVSLAALDLLARVEPLRATDLGGLDRLRIDHGGGGLRVAFRGDPRLVPQGVVEPLQGAVAAPPVEVITDRAGWGEVVGQGEPVAALVEQVEDGVDDLAKVGGAAAGPRRSRGA